MALSIEQAKVIKTWRVELGCSWRRVAELYMQVWADRDITQMHGIELCAEAAELLGEDVYFDPWN
jgi:hypothetical protein